MIEFICPNCNQPITVPAKAAGRAGICPECRARVVVPGERAGEAPAPAPSAMDARKDLEPMASDDAPEAPAPAPEAGADDEVVRQPCPFCGELIAATAQKCRFCGESLELLAANDGAAMVDTGRNPAVKGNTARHAAVSGNTGRNPAAKGNTGRHGAIKGDTERNPAVRGRTARHAVVNGATARNRAVAGGGAGKPSRSAPTGWMIGVVAALLIIVGIAFAMHSSRQAEAERQRMEAEERRLAEEKRQQQEKERQERLRRLEEANKETQRRLEQERAEKERQRLEAERKELQEQLRVEQDARAEEQRKRQAKADAEKQAEEEEKRHVAALKQAYHGADGGMVETLLNETRYRDNPEVRALRQRWLKVREHMEAGDAEEKKGNLEAAIAAWGDVRLAEPNANNGYHRQAKEKIAKYPPEVVGKIYLRRAKAAFDAKQYARVRMLLAKAETHGQDVAKPLAILHKLGNDLFNQGVNEFNRELYGEGYEHVNDAMDCFLPSDEFYSRIERWMRNNDVTRRKPDTETQETKAPVGTAPEQAADVEKQRMAAEELRQQQEERRRLELAAQLREEKERAEKERQRQYKYNYRVDDKGNAILCQPSSGVPCVSPKPDGVLIVPESIDGHTITGIENCAFENCDAMTRIVLPPQLEQLPTWISGWITHGNVFKSCAALASIEIAPANPKFTSENGALYSKDKTTLFAYPKNRDAITFAKETTKIEGDAFNSCTFAVATIPEGITNFGAFVFSGCRNLETVEFPQTTKFIGHRLFFECPNMKRVVFHGDAPEAYYRRTRRRENIFCESRNDIIVEVKRGSKGWAGKGTTYLPARWPLDGSDSRPIRYLR